MIDEIIKNIEQEKIETKKSVMSERYIEGIKRLNEENIHQKKISGVLNEFLKSKEGKFFKEKIKVIDGNAIKLKGIHGIEHSNRVSMITAIIAEQEQLELNDKMLDILISGGFFHDVGRVADFGKHSRRSAKVIDKMKLTFLNGEKYGTEDMKMLEALVEAHEGTDEEALKIPEKYEVSKENVEINKTLIKILRDADALDRARVSTINHMGLRTEFLRTKSAKSLIEFSFELEALTREEKDFQEILNYDKNF